MKSCNVGEEEHYRWGSPYFEEFFSGCIKFPQVLVGDYPNKMLFEIAMDIDLSIFTEVIPVLPGSVIVANDGRPAMPVHTSAVETTALTRFVRVPNIEELEFYERYSKL